MTHSPRAWLALSAASLALLTLSLPPLALGAPKPQSPAVAPSGLNLTPAQNAQAEARQAQFQKDLAALKADTKLTDAQKQAKFQTMYQTMDKDMLAILTPAQRAQVTQRRKINTQFQKSVAALKADTKLTEAQKQTKLEALVRSNQTAMLATLPPEQRALAEARIVRANEVKRLNKQLLASETPTQSKQIHDLSLATGKQIQDVIADTTLSEEAKVQKITSLRQAAETKINALLTPAQRAQYAHIRQIAATPSAP